MTTAIRSITQIQDADDFTDTTGAGTDTYSVTWDNGTSKFVLTNVTGGGGSPGGADTQVQYNNAGAFGGEAGMTYDAANDALTVVGRVVTPVIRPASDSTTAVQIQTSAGSSVLNVDTTNSRVGIGSTSPSYKLQVIDAGGAIAVANTESNSVNTFGRMVTLHYTKAEEPLILLSATSTSSLSQVDFGGGSGIFNTATVLNFYAAANTTTLTGTKVLEITTGGAVLTGRMTALDYNPSSGSTTVMKLHTGHGGLSMTNTEADATNKVGRYYVRHYTNAEQPVLIAMASNTASSNTLSYGGGTSLANAATSLKFYAAANNTTVTGTEIMRMTTVGLSIGTAANPTAILTLAASTTSKASLNIPSGTAPSSPTNGDIWSDGSDLLVRLGGTTYTLNKT